eukprot:GHRR01011459.1.p2 GENE.GHRR01011459.1~~GHRR01011459.1.p2  ORF type:complete len:186 (+),score=50.30 GHRR01011459.1:92-649(+)
MLRRSVGRLARANNAHLTAALALHGLSAPQLRAVHCNKRFRTVSKSAEISAAETSEPVSLYSRPQLYDDVFSYRDFSQEAKFLMGGYQQHSQSGTQLQNALELGCGPANHVIQLAKRRVKAWALDCNPSMLEYAAAKAAEAGALITTVQGDMSSFQIQVTGFQELVHGTVARSRLSSWSKAIGCT